MAGRISELLEDEKEASSQVKRTRIRSECSELIIRLWEMEAVIDPDNPINRLNRKLDVLLSWTRSAGLRDPQSLAKLDGSEDYTAMDVGKLANHLTGVCERERSILFLILTEGLHEIEADDEYGNLCDKYGVDQKKLSDFIKYRQTILKPSNFTAIEKARVARTQSVRLNALIGGLALLNEERQRIVAALAGKKPKKRGKTGQRKSTGQSKK